MKIEQDQLVHIGELVVEAAQEIFATCGAENDFCIQSLSSYSAVFGGVNRIIWSPHRGFRVDPPYCTQRFQQEFKAHYK